MTDASNDLLRRYITEFFGYGDLSSPLWFIGMEEAGGASRNEIDCRLKAWSDLGASKTVDLFDFHELIGVTECFETSIKPKLQPTWSKLIRYLLAYENASVDRETVRNCQVSRFGRIGSNTCLLELLPLPSPQVGVWHYKEYYDLPVLRSREVYTDKISKIRIKSLRELIELYRPKRVVFYGKTYLKFWADVIGGDVVWKNGQDICFAVKNNVNFFVLPHPVSRGVTNHHYESAARVAT